jgi:hypothetical protein
MAEPGIRKVNSLGAFRQELDCLTLRGTSERLYMERLSHCLHGQNCRMTWCKPSEAHLRLRYGQRCPSCSSRHFSWSGQKKICCRKLRQDLYASLLARGSETVYVVTPDHVPVAGTYQEIQIVKLPGPPAWCLPGDDSGNIEVEKHVEPRGLDVSEGVISAVLRHWSNTNGEISFETHVGTQASLLRACHQAQHDEESFSQAQANLRSYVFLVSNDKMLDRLEKGMGATDFYTVLAAVSRADFPPGAFEQDIDDRHLRTSTPNTKQADLIRKFWTCCGLDDNEDHKQPLYDLRGRQSFQRLLAASLFLTRQALKGLKTRIVEIKEAGCEYSDQAVGEVTKLVQRAKSMLTHLFNLTFHFRTLLPIHLEWLSQFAKADSSDASSQSGFTQDDLHEHRQSGDAFAYLAVRSVGKPECGTWAAEAFAYLRLICLPHYAMLEVTSFDPANKSALQEVESRQVRDSTIVVTDITRIFREDQPTTSGH